MRVPSIEHGSDPTTGFFKPELFEEVRDLILGEGLTAPDSSEDLNGIALLARDEKWEGEGPPPVVAFVWALAAGGNPTSYVDYFVVKKELRGTMIGVFLLGTLVMVLRGIGIKKIKTVVPPGYQAHLRMLRKRGADDQGVHHFVILDLEDRHGIDQNGDHHQPAESEPASG